MLASVPNPREVFRSDEFLVQLAQPTNVRFSLYEHAPLSERQEKFREAITQRKLALVGLFPNTYIDNLKFNGDVVCEEKLSFSRHRLQKAVTGTSLLAPSTAVRGSYNTHAIVGSILLPVFTRLSITPEWANWY
uniref:Transposase n=1 Tax=Angiostrongylus cantonensis TaxID=6313 RepID=A0A158P9V1_ANGCA